MPSALPGLASVIGHRGAAARAPENTLAGLRKAKALGADWVEFDVMLSGDGVPVLIHDETLQRTTDGRGGSRATRRPRSRVLDAGAWFGPAFTGERIPTLTEAVSLLLELGLNANVEIKPSTGEAEATGEVVAGALRRLWPEDGPRLLLSSFEREVPAGGPPRRGGDPARLSGGAAAVGLGGHNAGAGVRHPASGPSPAQPRPAAANWPRPRCRCCSTR